MAGGSMGCGEPEGVGEGVESTFLVGSISMVEDEEGRGVERPLGLSTLGLAITTVLELTVGVGDARGAGAEEVGMALITCKDQQDPERLTMETTRGSF
jgi:hypothetical protein